MVGGRVGSAVTTSSVERFDGAWATMPPMTHSRCLCTTAVIAEKLYVSGGVNIPDTVERFDPASETWELVRPALHRRVGATVAVLRDRRYMVGGMGDDDIVLDSVECYDTDSLEESVLVSHAQWRQNGQGQLLSLCDWWWRSQCISLC